MTVIVAIGCSDGVVIAADSASSDTSAGTKQVTSAKIRQLREFPIAFGGSGDVGLLQRVYEEVAKIGKPDKLAMLTEYRTKIKRNMSPLQQEAVKLHVPHPQFGGMHGAPVASVLLVGATGGKSWIFEFDGSGADTHYDDDLGNFVAIGSGKQLAQAYFRPHLFTPRNCKLGQIFAYRIVDDCINIAMAMLGHPIHIHTIYNDGKYEKVSTQDLKTIADSCEVWRTLEREAVGKLLTPPSSESNLVEIPKPPITS